MAAAGSLNFSHKWGICKNQQQHKKLQSGTRSDKLHIFPASLSSFISRQDSWNVHLSGRLQRPLGIAPSRCNLLKCNCFLNSGQAFDSSTVKNGALALSRALQGRPIILKLLPAVGIVVFAVWGLGPLMRQSRNFFTRKSDGSWGKSSAHYVTTSYLQPLLLWTGAMLICRSLDPVVLPSEASQIVKQRLVTFVRSLSTVLAFAYCLSSVIQQTQKFFMETNATTDTRNMGFEFAGKAVYTAVWVAAVSLFMELLGFSTQKWLTAGGLGTVLLTLAGREIFTNFLSSAMIHATRPFVVNEWIKAKIEGYDVSGTVEHVGWWSPTIIRGEDREAIHIPNHKFTVNVVRNLTQKTHWRIKTHLAISHLDVGKINIIVADMRKVLAKNPQVEQQRLHRRVFLENVDPENQALMILVSCFVKTSHYEEYLCVKEAILLDLLRVISHHRARLATPLRTVQKIYNDSDLDGFPFADSVFTRGRAASNRPYLLIEPQYKVNGEDKSKGQSSKSPVKPSSKAEGKGTPNSKAKDTPASDAKSADKGTPDAKEDAVGDERLNPDYTNTDKKVGISSTSDGKPNTKATVKSVSKKEPELTESTSSDDKITASDELLASSSNDKQPPADSNKTGGIASSSESKRENEPQFPRSAMEDNIVLGVALEGSKRTLPIEEGMNDASPASAEVKELTPSRTRKGSPSAENDKNDSININVPSSTSTDQK